MRRPFFGPGFALHLTLSILAGGAVTLVWALTGGFFWPMWVWFGLAIPVGMHAALRWAILTYGGRMLGLAIHGAVTGVVCGVLLAIWVLTGADAEFWPAIPVGILAFAFGAHALVIAMLERFNTSERERELSTRVDQLTRTRRGALDVQAAELRRIERDLHDGAQARLVALTMQLGRAEQRLDDHPEVAELVRRARDEAGAAIAELRDLARGIAPPVLADRGLVAAVEALGRRAAIPVTVDAFVSRRPPPVVETAAYFVVAESLTNVAKHAGGAAAQVTLVQNDGKLLIDVTDEGPGGADPSGGGLSGLRGRVEALDGTLRIASPAGRGTRIQAELPCES